MRTNLNAKKKKKSTSQILLINLIITRERLGLIPPTFFKKKNRKKESLIVLSCRGECLKCTLYLQIPTGYGYGVDVDIYCVGSSRFDAHRTDTITQRICM